MSDETRKISAVLFSDIAGYTAAMGRDEEAAIRAVSRSRTVQKELVRKHEGVWLQEIGDGAMCTFDSAVQAVACSLEIQRAFRDDPDFQLRIGIHVGDLVFRKTEIGTDIFGDAVNVASRVQGVADPGGICVSERVYDDLRNRKGFRAEFIGEKQLKNVNRPIRVYRIIDPEAPGASPVEEVAAPESRPRARSEAGRRWVVPAALAAGLAVAGAVWVLFSPSSPPSAPEVEIARVPEPAPTPPAVTPEKTPAELEPAPPAAETPSAEEGLEAFLDVRGALLASVGPWSEAGAKVWTEPDPVKNDETYHIRFEANCDCNALLFSIDGSSQEVVLLYPNPYEQPEALAPGDVREIPSQEGTYTLRAVGGQGLDVLKLIVTPRELAFPSNNFKSWIASPENEKAVAELAALLESLDGDDWGTADTALHISR